MTPRTLYPSGPTLSRISLGGSTFGREIDQAAAFALMDHARERGVTLFDTAATYSAGASEQIVGAWLESRRPSRSALMVATKIYPPFTPPAIEKAVHESAARLGVETIDVLYLHKWDSDAATEAAVVTLDGLVKAGRVGVLGASNFGLVQLSTVLTLQSQLGLAPFRILQNNHNYAIRDVDDALIDLCWKSRLAVVTYSPLGGGYLTGKHRRGVQPGSRFDVSPGHQQVYFNTTAEERLNRLEAVARTFAIPQEQLALAWSLSRSGVDSVLVGGRKPSHLDQAFSALELSGSAALAELNRE